jgi:hypothetical protein
MTKSLCSSVTASVLASLRPCGCRTCRGPDDNHYHDAVDPGSRHCDHLVLADPVLSVF